MSDVVVGANRQVRVRVPDGWESQTGRSSTALFAVEGGFGAVNVSVVRHAGQGAVDAAGLLSRFAGPAAAVEVTGPRALPGGESVWETAYEKGGTAWRVWAVCRGRTVAVLSYNCADEHRGAEDLVVEEIVESVRVSE